MRTIIFILFILVFSFCDDKSSDPLSKIDSPDKAKEIKTRAEKKANGLARRLDMDESQQVKVQAFYIEAEVGKKILKDQAASQRLTKEERKNNQEKIAGVSKTLNKKILSILNKEQNAKFQEQLASQEAKRKDKSRYKDRSSLREEKQNQQGNPAEKESKVPGLVTELESILTLSDSIASEVTKIAEEKDQKLNELRQRIISNPENKSAYSEQRRSINLESHEKIMALLNEEQKAYYREFLQNQKKPERKRQERRTKE